MNIEEIGIKLKQLGKKNWLIIAGLVGILLIGLSTVTVGDDTPQNTSAIPSGEESKVYVAELEQQLESMIASIHGVGACDVMVTLEQGTEYIYAVQEKSTQDTSTASEESRITEGERVTGEETYIMVSTANGQQPLLVTSIAPKVKGVVVVCAGGGDLGTCERVRGAIATALNVSHERIYVTAGNIS